MFLIRLKTFLKSLAWHIYAGFPKTTAGEIADRYAICLTCDQHDINKQQCNVCGCVIKNKSIFLNKLAWADQECPLGKWNKIQR